MTQIYEYRFLEDKKIYCRDAAAQENNNIKSATYLNNTSVLNQSYNIFHAMGDTNPNPSFNIFCILQI